MNQLIHKAGMMVAMLLSFLSATAYDFDVDGIHYDILSSQTCEVAMGSARSSDGIVIIPSSVEYKNKIYTVTKLGYYAFGGSSMTSIVIPNSITKIGDSAFSGCRFLSSIVIPNSVTVIGEYAFGGCHSLTSVELPNTITSISKQMFAFCRSLASIVIPNTVTKIGDEAFLDCRSLTSIEIPNTVTKIGDDAFRDCHSLRSIAIPNSVTEIGAKAFSNCSSLTSVELSNSITSIKQELFSECTSLASIEIPNSVTEIGAKVFSNCSSLTSVELSKSLIAIGESAFSGCTSLASIAIPNSVTKIGDYTFSGCSSLTSVELSDSITTIKGLFYGCTALASIEIPNSVTEIEYYAFYNCSSLTSIEIPNTVTKIGDHAFESCSSLTSIEIPESVEGIGWYVFKYCGSLESLTIPATVTHGGGEMLDLEGCDKLKSLYFLSPCISSKEYRSIVFPPSIEYIYWNSPSFPSGASVDKTSCSFTVGELCTYLGCTFDKLTIEEGSGLIINIGQEESATRDYTLDYLSLDRSVSANHGFFTNSFTFYPKQLVLGEHVTDCNEKFRGRVGTRYINYLESKAMVPPIISDFSQSQYIDLEPVVPAEAIDAYREAPVWKEFWNLRPMASVDEIDSPSKHEIGRYDLQGRKIDDDYSGIAIVRYSDGSTKKIVAKP